MKKYVDLKILKHVKQIKTKKSKGILSRNESDFLTKTKYKFENLFIFSFLD